MPEWLQKVWRFLCGSRMLYGWRRADGVWLAHTRISSAAHIEARQLLDIHDHVYIGPFNLIDASGGLSIGEGAQITSHCSVLTHSSHRAVRLAGRRYWGAANPPGFERAATHIGAYSFIGPHSVLTPGCHVGRGVVVRAFSYVSGSVPDFAIVSGQPARVVGDTRTGDVAWLAQNPQHQADYDAWAGPR